MIAKQKIHGFSAAFDYNDKKMGLKDVNERAELLEHNFLEYDRQLILKEISFFHQLRPNLTRDAYHVSLNFGLNDNLSPKQLAEIGKEYLKGMGFDDNAYAIWQHFDADHLHIHVLASRIRYDGSVVSDSNNYQRSENLCRQLERKYDIENVKSSKDVLERAPSKDELEMVQRTGQPSDRMLMQERVKEALANSHTLYDFISQCKQRDIYLLFNQSETTGRVSGITYISSDGFMARGQALGNMFKWKKITDKLNYEQGRDSKTISEANSATRERFKDLLDGRNKSREIRTGKSVRTTGEYDEKSGRTASRDGGDGKEGNINKFGTTSRSDEGIREPEQDTEKAVYNKFSVGTSSVINGIGGLFGTTGAEEVDDNDKRRKRKTRR